MDFKQIWYFLQIVEAGSFSSAAEDLYISQSSLSKQIIALEKELSLQLFDRTKRRIQITAAGEKFLEYARKIQRLQLAMLADLAEYQEIPNLSVVAIPVIAQYGITAYIANFQTLHPEISFTLEEREAADILPALDNRQADLAFLRDNYLDEEKYAFLEVAQDKFVVLLSNQHPLASQKTISLNDLRSENFIMFDKGTTVHELAVDACREAGYEPRIFYASLRVESILGLVASQAGVALMMEKVFHYRKHPEVTAVPLVETVTSKIILAYPRGKKLSQPAKSFLEFIESHKSLA